MTTPLAQLLTAFKVCYWKMNTTSRLITMDSNISTIIDTQTTEFSYEHLFGLVVPEQRIDLITKINSYPASAIEDFSFKLSVNGQVYSAHIVIDQDTSDHILSGGVRLELSPQECTSSSQNTCQADSTHQQIASEQTLRTTVSCRAGILPFSLTLATRHIEITLYEDGKLVQKIVSADDFTSSIHPENRAGYMRSMEQLFSKQHITQPAQLKFQSNYLTGKYRWYELHCDHCSGTYDKYIGVLHDIDLHERGDESMKRSVDFFTSIYEHIPVGVELYDSKGIFIYSNPKTQEIFGIDNLDDVRGLSLFDDPALPLSFKESLCAGNQVITEIDYDLSCTEPYYETTRSGVLKLQSRGVPIFDSDNNILYYMVVNLDDTENNHVRSTVNDFENFFSAIAEFAHIGYCKWDILARKGFAIDQWMINMGEKPGTDITKVLEQDRHIHPEDREKLLKSIQQMINGEVLTTQQELRIYDNETDNYKWIYHNAIVTRYAPQVGSIEVVIANTDITKLKRTKQQLIEANKQATELIAQRDVVINNLSSAIVYINTDYIVQWGNVKALSHIFEDGCYAPGQKCYKTAFNRNEPCKDCPLAIMINTKQKLTHCIKYKCACVEVVTTPAFDNNGNLLGGIVKLDDVTTRELNEHKIKELNHLMDAILNNIPVFLFVKDPNNDFKYLYWNKATADHTKIQTEIAIGRNDFEILPNKEDAARLRYNDLQLIENGTTSEIEELISDQDGNNYYFNTVRVLIPTEEKLPWILGFSWNITELKKSKIELIIAKEKAEESDKFKSSFLANISHEIRTPLNAIIGFSELLMDNCMDPSDRIEYLNIIRKNNTLLLQLVSDILDLSRIEARMIEYVYDKVDINTLCNRIAMSGRLREELKVPLLFNESLPYYFITSDENRINQVLSNLVTNAIKFTHNGSIEIGYQLLNDTELEIYVQDTGVGIPQDKISHVFDRFVKLDSFVQGTGLGLSICKNLIEQLGGRINVESEKGRGSRFSFVIPYDKQDDNML